MKKVGFVMLAITSLFFFSCEAEEPQVYSCDKNLDEWAHRNLSEIKSMKRSDWNLLEEDYKRAAYAAFTQEQRVALWLEKIEQVLTLDWSDEEVEHILELKDFILSHQNWFHGKELTEVQANEVELFGYEWMTKGEENLGWDKKLIYALIGSANNLVDKSGLLEVQTRKRMISYQESKCDCNQKYDFCITTHCEDSPCEEASGGCGWFLMGACNGTCGGL